MTDVLDQKHRSGTDAVSELAQRATAPHEVQGGKVYVVVDPNGGVERIDLDTDDYRDRPKRKAGAFTVSTPQAFCDYMEKHSTGDSEIWANVNLNTGGDVVAVINAHGATDAGFGDHRLNLKLVQSPEWVRWAANDRKAMSQKAFAELVEDRLIDIIEPTSADMLEIAQTFEAKNDVRFASSTILASGERQLVFKENIEASAGRSGTMTVPQTFTLALRPFLGGEPWKVEARFRYKISEGQLSISYALTRPEDVIQRAFDEVVSTIDSACDAPVYSGIPAR